MIAHVLAVLSHVSQRPFSSPSFWRYFHFLVQIFSACGALSTWTFPRSLVAALAGIAARLRVLRVTVRRLCVRGHPEQLFGV